ncbi:putative serine/threonine-protein phosphatase 2A regulatory subunit B'' subunit TON2 [Camellia lanceoleosa]|uniref:Serine/threonine-protein phosphatase 2A regulatory subunit B'' subunit TON2 n=1 Tax=Camellia lanceoleosa TaxID=1840588 RepID=A0ACC0FMC2_9ERIC|nr:putative serine/threonine-protein phosphatase 2A regulatory subunit B'' subunit TON2 [Camellia lanceoleosa]
MFSHSLLDSKVMLMLIHVDMDYRLHVDNIFMLKPEEGSISHRVQRVAKYHFLKRQSNLLLNANDLDAMWVCFKENCVIDDATGASKMNYEDFCHITYLCTEQIGPKCRRFFSSSNFMKFEKDESGRIAILPFYLYVMHTVLMNLTNDNPCLCHKKLLPVEDWGNIVFIDCWPLSIIQFIFASLQRYKK